MGVGPPGLGTSGIAVSWMTLAGGLVSVEGEGVGIVGSPPGVRRMTDRVPELETDDSEGDAGGVLPGSAAGVSPGTDEDEVEDGGGWLLASSFEIMLEASLGERVVVVVVLTELANTVTVTVRCSGGSSSFGLPVFTVDNEVVVELDDGMLDDGEVELSEPAMPPLTPAAFIRPITVLSLVQTRDVPEARTSGMAKHC